LGANETTNENKNITIYPNPCNSQINVKINKEPYITATISIIDITGKTIIQTQTTKYENIFNTEKLAKGLYLIKVESGGSITLTKVTKE
jgi:hypothetical protein